MACFPERVTRCCCGCSLFVGSVLIAVLVLLESLGDLGNALGSNLGDDVLFTVINVIFGIVVNAIGVVVA